MGKDVEDERRYSLAVLSCRRGVFTLHGCGDSTGLFWIGRFCGGILRAPPVLVLHYAESNKIDKSLKIAFETS